MWTTMHFPAAMRSLNTSTRAKAIEIANGLLEKGQMDKAKLITYSVEQARRWARRSPVDVTPVTAHPFATR